MYMVKLKTFCNIFCNDTNLSYMTIIMFEQDTYVLFISKSIVLIIWKFLLLFPQQGFFELELIKIYLKTTMNQDRLPNSALLSIKHK